MKKKLLKIDLLEDYHFYWNIVTFKFYIFYDLRDS